MNPVTVQEFESRLSEQVAALAQPLIALDEEVLGGTVTSFDQELRRVMIRDESGNSHIFTWDDKTSWVLDGKQSTPKDVLRSGRTVSIKHNSERVAISVSADTE